MRIGILTFHRAYNYGAALQCYGLQQALLKLGHEPVVLDFHPPAKFGWKYYIWLFMKNPVDRLWQRSLFDRFAEKNFRLSSPLHSMDDIEEQLKGLDMVMVGSDQVWNSHMKEFHDAFLLRFKTPIRRASYGSCVGRADQPQNVLEHVGKSLSSFDHISVRNQMSQDLVRKLTGREAALNVDPTFLVDFENVTARTQRSANSLLLYHLGMPPVAMAAVKQQLQKDLPVQFLSVSCVSQFFGADHWAWGVGPGEWLGLMKSAKYVLTESFHGAIFAIKNRRQFLVYAQPEWTSRFRLLDLLGRYGLQDRLITSPSEATGERMLRPIDYDRVHAAIAADVEASYEYLKQATS